MDKTNFGKLMVSIFNYFQSVKMPSKDQVDLWFEQIKHIPNEATDFIEKQIYQDKDSLPRNLPKVIRESYDNYPKTSKFFKYDHTEDHRFPVSKMIDGLNILKSKGETAFYNFAKSVQMPTNDQDRVRMKLAVMSGGCSFDVSKIKWKIGQTVYHDHGFKNVQERISVLKHQADTILREPGEEFNEDTIPF